MSFAEISKFLRKEKNISQMQLANALNLSNIPEARPPGFPVSILPLYPLFARPGRPPSAPSRYIIYYKHI